LVRYITRRGDGGVGIHLADTQKALILGEDEAKEFLSMCNIQEYVEAGIS
jgi:hypothetical protein